MNKDTFAKLVIDSTDSLYRVSKSILQNDSDCEDAVSEAITIAFQKLDTLKKDEYAKTWLTRILINECFHIRKQQRKIELISADNESILNSQKYSDNRSYTDSDNCLDLYQAMQKLTDNQKLAITLYYYEGYSITEIARMTRVTQGTVKSRLNRARNHLKQFLKEDEYYA